MARECLDELLLQRATESGATVFQPLRAVALEQFHLGLFVRPNDRPFEARAVIAAHGSWEPGELPTQARRSAPQASDLLAFKAHFVTRRSERGHDRARAFPGGYGGVLKLADGRATFACCIRRDGLGA